MKKMIAALLTLMLCACAFGAPAEQEPVKEEIPVMGLSFAYPQEMIDAKGAVGTDGGIALGEDVYYAYWYYAGMTMEELNRKWATEPEEVMQKTDLLFYVFAVGENRDFSAVNELTTSPFDAEKAIQIGQAGSWTYYLYITHNPGFAETVPAEYYDEYTALCGLADKYAAAFSFYEPVSEPSEAETDGTVISFETKDLDGNPVSSVEIFAQHEITMVNVWATWCGPCVGELGELQQIHTRFLEKDCAIVGVMTDDDIASARQLISRNGITYQIVMCDAYDFYRVFPTEGIPTSFFVDRDGRFLGTTIVGAYPNKYESALEPLLEQVKTAKEQ